MLLVDFVKKIGDKEFMISIFKGKKKFNIKTKNIMERNEWFDMIKTKSTMYKSMDPQGA